MSNYTTQLRRVVTEHMERFEVDEDKAHELIIGNYPLFDENYRTVLNRKIFRHYGFREIGLETPELFKYFLQNKMNEIMQYYNQVYKSESVDFNPLYNIDITESYEHDVLNDNIGSSDTTNEGKSKTNSDSTNNSTTDNISHDVANSVGKDVMNDVPQSGTTFEDIDNHTYITSYERHQNNDTTDNTSNSKTKTDNEYTESNDTTSSSNTSYNGKMTTTESYVKKTLGSSAGLPFSKAIKQWREIMLKIDVQIIEDLEPLFFGLW